MNREITLSQYLIAKEKSNMQIFIFLLNGEYPYLNNENTWMHSIQTPAYFIRMTEEEFHTMDFAVHPKIVGTKKGKEIFEINGLPSLKYLQHKISQN